MTRENALLTQFAKEVTDHLEQQILPFWINRMVDRENGGFFGRIDGQNRLHRLANKGVILNTRILWTFSAAYQQRAQPVYLDLANRAHSYLESNFLDPEYGGVFWELDSSGHPVQTKKQVYAQAFAIYAWTEHFKATGAPASLNLARSLFKLMETKAFDPIYGGYFEAFQQDWSETDDLRLSDKDQNDQKSMNTMLHLLEAFTSLAQVWPDQHLRRQLKKIVIAFLHHILDPGQWSFNLFFAADWTVRSIKTSFGHDIEAAWLLHKAARQVADRSLLRQVEEMVINVADQVISNGIDQQGGLIYEKLEDGKFDTDRHWWPQAELMVGLLDAWQISHDFRYLEVALKNWEFTRKYIIDGQDEWHFRVNQAGQPYHEEDKAGFWKCPYHNSRFCLEVSERISDMRIKT